MVTITNHAPLSQVFSVRSGGSESLPPGATDEFDLVDADSPAVGALEGSGQITVIRSDKLTNSLPAEAAATTETGPA